jgi:ferrous iron transport protein A
MKAQKEKTLDDLATGARGRIRRICAQTKNELGGRELERRLLELGFVEEEEIEVLHHGPIGRDPIAVKVGNQVLALRRAEAKEIILED